MDNSVAFAREWAKAALEGVDLMNKLGEHVAPDSLAVRLIDMVEDLADQVEQGDQRVVDLCRKIEAMRNDHEAIEAEVIGLRAENIQLRNENARLLEQLDATVGQVSRENDQ